MAPLNSLMEDTVLIPALIVALLICAFLALRIWYANYRAGMTPAQREAEDRLHDSDQVW